MQEQFISTEVVKWAQGVLDGLGHVGPFEVTPVVETAFSCVKKLTSGGEVFYLKKTPPTLFIEAEIINFLRKECGVTSIPETIGQNRSLDCFLMKPCGEESLRTMFAKTFDMGLFLQGVQNYKVIQKSTEKKTAQLLEMGVPDWRLSKLPVMYNDMVQDQSFLKRCNMTQEQVRSLQKLQGTFADLCAELAVFGMPDCLNHSDFQENNMLFDKVTQKVSVIDWGEVTIGNPVMALTKPIASLCTRNRIDADTRRAAEERLFGDFFKSPQDMSRALAVIGKMSWIYYIFTLRKLEELTGQTSERWSSGMGGAFGSFLSVSS